MEYNKPTFEDYYLRVGREPVESDKRMEHIRKEHFEAEGYMVDDLELLKWDLEQKQPCEAVSEPLEKQVGGTHYTTMAIKPTEYIEANDIKWSEGNVIKYISRHQGKNGRKDVEKAIHYCELILKQYDEVERRKANLS